MYSKNDQAWELAMRKRGLPGRQTFEVKVTKDSSSLFGKWAISSKKRITTYNISHHASSFMPKVFLSVSLAAAAARCFALAWQIAIHHGNVEKLGQCSKLGDFSISSRADEYDWVLAWQNHTKFLIERNDDDSWMNGKWMISCPWYLIEGRWICENPNWKNPWIHGESRFGLSHLIGKINIFQLSYQFSLSRSCRLDIWSCCQCDNYSGAFFKKNLEVPKDIPDLKEKIPMCKTIHSSSRVCCFCLASRVPIWICLWVLSQHLLVEGLILCHGFCEGIFKRNSWRIQKTLPLQAKNNQNATCSMNFRCFENQFWAMENIDLAKTLVMPHPPLLQFWAAVPPGHGQNPANQFAWTLGLLDPSKWDDDWRWFTISIR